MTASKRPTTAQLALLKLGAVKAHVNFYEAIRAGAPGPTLATAVKRGWMVKNEYPDGSADWSITDAGRAVLDPHTAAMRQES